MFRTSGTNSKVIELIFLYVSQPWGAEEPSGVFSEFGSKMIVLRILKGLGVGPGSATERWPCRKNEKNQFFFFVKKIKITSNYLFFLYILSIYAKILGETNFQSQEFPRSG